MDDTPQFFNNIQLLIREDLSSTDTIITVDNLQGIFLEPDSYLVGTIIPSGGQGSLEIVHVVGISGNDLTVVRGQEGTTPQTFLFGANLALNVTAGILDYLKNAPQKILDQLEDTTDITKGDALIGVKQPYTGAVPLTQHQKNTEILNQQEFVDTTSFDLARVGKVSIDGDGNLDAPVKTIVRTSTMSEIVKTALKASAEITTRPAYLEQHFSGFFGRGMLDTEFNGLITEQFVTSNAAAGSDLINCGDKSGFMVGGCATILHDNGLYGTYFISAKSTDNLALRPRLRYSCTAGVAKISRTWFNKAHPGKYYMRELAQRIAHSTELEAAMPNDGKRVLFSNFSSNPNTVEDTLIPVGGATITYQPASNVGESGNTLSPVRFGFGRTALVTVPTTGAGGETPYFDSQGVDRAIVKVVMFAGNVASTHEVNVYDENNISLQSYNLDVGVSQGVLRVYSFPVETRGARSLKIRVSVISGSGAYFAVQQIDCFEAPTTAGKIITKPGATIVCIGDSWVAGDLSGSPEREPITQQLALELPEATIINAGIGGNKIWEMIARFATDVAPYKPDYVVVVTGTNESYNPASGIFDPNSIDAFISYYRILLSQIAAIGARPIIVGVPALAQSDPDTPTFPEWTLNDRARAYSKAFFEMQGERPVVSYGINSNGEWSKYENGDLICRHRLNVTTTAINTIASVVWTFPVPSLAGYTPRMSVTVADYNSNQVFAVGAQGTSVSSSAITLVSTAGPATVAIDVIMYGRWK